MGDLDSRDGANASEYIAKMLMWNDHMFDKPIDQLKKIVNSPSYNRFIRIKFSWKQLKLPMEWYEKQCGLVNFNVETIMREIELKRIHGSNNSPFKRADLMYLMNHQREPIQKVDYSKNLCPIMIYEKILLNKVYILSVDPSEGLALDNNAFSLINPSTQKNAAEFKSPYISQPELFRLLCQFLDEFCPKSMIVIESNKGRELINLFLESKYRYQLYYDDGKLGDKVIEKTDPYGALKKAAMERRAYGIWTGSNRSQYYAILENIMEERKDILLTPYLVEDVCGLIRKPNGRVESGPSLHDDNIMSYLIGMFIYLHSPYEKLEQYGIRRGATDDISDYTETGEITEEGTLRRLKEMLPSLPESMQELIVNALGQKDPVTEAQAYYKEVQLAKTQIDVGGSIDNGMTPGPSITPSAAPMDDAFWSQYDAKVWESNFDPTDPVSVGSFNIEDYVDF